MFIDLIRRVHSGKGAVRVLDVGGTAAYWENFDPADLNSLNVEITLLNPQQSSGSNGRFHSISGDGRDIKCDDNAYDFVHSNSVIEHVGNHSDMLSFAGEVRRVAKSYFVQTPNYWFPVEPHYRTAGFHWLPISAREQLLLRMSLGSFAKAVDVAEAQRAARDSQLLTERRLRSLFPDAEIAREKTYGLTKSLTAYRLAV